MQSEKIQLHHLYIEDTQNPIPVTQNPKTKNGPSVPNPNTRKKEIPRSPDRGVQQLRYGKPLGT